MRKTISLLLVLIMLLTPVTALADDGNLRHDVHGDVSQFEVSEELDRVNEDTEGAEATMGTDVYLFVDPDTASYVIFYVTDEEGNPIEDALIYLGYAGDMELFGVTNKEGLLGTYLFRDVEYSYRVYKPGYETVDGLFTATEEITVIRVVLRKYHKLEIQVVDGDKIVPGVTVTIDGVEYTTDENGLVTVYRPNGVYDVEVIAPDGRRFPVKAVVNGDTRIVVDIALDKDGIVPGGLYQDRFLVYDRDYAPEDYVLTKYMFSEEHVEAEQAEDYLAATRNTLLIEAMCDHEQHENAPDTDIYDSNRQPRFSQRSLMPSGYVLRSWEKEGFEKLVFINEELGIRFDPAALHSGDMMKLYALIWWLSGNDAELSDIAREEVSNAWNGYADAGFDKVFPWDLQPEKVDFDAVRDFVFDFEESESKDILPTELYTGSLFEFRVTPIRPEAMLKMLNGELTGEHAVPVTEMTLASYGYFAEELRRHLSLGKLSDMESDELFAFFADGRLSKEEIQTLREKKSDGTLTDGELELLLKAAADEKLYRVSCHLRYGTIDAEITGLIDGLEIIRKADRQFDERIAELESKDSSLSSAQLAAKAEEELLKRYEFLLICTDPVRYSMDGYKAGEFAALYAPSFERALDEGAEFFPVLMERHFQQYTVDVRREISPLDGESTLFRAYITEGSTMLDFSRALVTELNDSALSALAIKD